MTDTCIGIESLFGSDFWDALTIDRTGKTCYDGMSMVDFPSAPGVNPIASLYNRPIVSIGQVTNCSPLPAAWFSPTLLVIL